MFRLRFYRLLLPAILVVFLVVLALQLRPSTGAHSRVDIPVVPGSSGTGITAVDMDGDRKTMEVNADGYSVREDGSVKLTDIRQVKVYRDDRPPLLIRAQVGDMQKQGAREIRFGEGVTLEDPSKGLTLTIPRLHLDERRREAWSEGQVRLEGADLRSTADSLIYHLDERPNELTGLDLSDDSGARVRSRRAILHDGLDDVELFQHVEIERGEEYLHADRLRVGAAPTSMEQIVASGVVEGKVILRDAGAWDLAGDLLDLGFDGVGEARTFKLEGGASVQRGTERLAANSIRAHRVESEVKQWRVTADGTAELNGRFQGERALLRGAGMNALVDPELGVVEAQATGKVSFDGPLTRAEADRMTYRAGVAGEVRMYGTERRKARLAREQTRINAEEIALGTDGRSLFAERNVEASLLPQEQDAGQAVGPFSTEEPIHFVSATLEGRDSNTLIFEGQVRGWQGERNLASDRMVLDQTAGTLTAEGNVSARMSRNSDEAAAGQADYVQITSARLSYAESEGLGVFQEDVRVQLAEGWLESEEVRVKLAGDGGGMSDVEAIRKVRIEFRRPSDDGGPPEVLTGQADRLVYSPEQKTVWLIGENEPASVRRIGEGSGTTTGRVLRYQLELGTLEVDSGKGGPATIRTGG